MNYDQLRNSGLRLLQDEFKSVEIMNSDDQKKAVKALRRLGYKLALGTVSTNQIVGFAVGVATLVSKIEARGAGANSFEIEVDLDGVVSGVIDL